MLTITTTTNPFFRFAWNFKNRVWKNEVNVVNTDILVVAIFIVTILVITTLFVVSIIVVDIVIFTIVATIITVVVQVNNKKAERVEMEKKAAGQRCQKIYRVFLVKIIHLVNICLVFSSLLE